MKTLNKLGALMLAMALSLTLATAASAEVTQDQLVGSWNAIEMDGEAPPPGASFVMVLNDDNTGTVTMTQAEFEMAGEVTYELIGNDQMQMSITMNIPGGQPQTEEVTLDVAFDAEGKLMMTETGGTDTVIFERAE